MNKKSRKGLISIVALLVLALIGSSLAYWNQTASVDNPFDTGKYGSIIKEDFTPDEGTSWQPGVEVDKEVWVENTGDQDLIVRIKLDETWTRKGETDAYKENKAGTYDVYNVEQADIAAGLPHDGLTAADRSVVHKKLNSIYDAVDNPTGMWVDGGDGWYYYRLNLEGKADLAGDNVQSVSFLESVTLDKEADMGVMVEKWYIAIDGDKTTEPSKWYEIAGNEPPAYVTISGDVATPCAKDAVGAQKVAMTQSVLDYKVDGGVQLLGYSDSNYILTVTVETVQATTEAVNATFGGGAAFPAPAGTAWVMREYH